jgi:hypothetical protein
MIYLYPYPVCVYCGVPVRSQRRIAPVTCACHRDLPELDPEYAEPDQWETA